MFGRVAAALSLHGLLISGGAMAQETLESGPIAVREGERIRVTTPSLRINRRVGIYDAVRNDSLFLRSVAKSASFAFAIPEVTRLDVSLGFGKGRVRTSLAWGAAGLVAGTLAGIGLGSALFENSTGCGTYDFTGCQEGDFGMALLGLFGGLTGATMSFTLSRRPRDKWRRVSLPQRSVQVRR